MSLTEKFRGPASVGTAGSWLTCSKLFRYHVALGFHPMVACRRHVQVSVCTHCTKAVSASQADGGGGIVAAAITRVSLIQQSGTAHQGFCGQVKGQSIHHPHPSVATVHSEVRDGVSADRTMGLLTGCQLLQKAVITDGVGTGQQSWVCEQLIADGADCVHHIVNHINRRHGDVMLLR